MRILIACEHSGTVREAFRALGHDAWSCDLLPSSDDSPFHMQMNALLALPDDQNHCNRPIHGKSAWLDFPWSAALYGGWDILIAHPPCTYLSISAAWAFSDPDFDRYPGIGYHQKVKPGTLTGEERRRAREDAVKFALKLWNSAIPRVCIENPVGHLSQHLGKSQLVQPYQFGDDASKSTCLWLKGLPPLRHGTRFPGRIVTHNGKQVERWQNQTDSGQNKLPPSDDRAHLRAITYPGIAKAMAEQWSNL